MRARMEAKQARGDEQRAEVQAVRDRKQGAERVEKAADKADLQAKMAALEQEKQIPIRAAQEEQRSEYKQSYA